MNDLKSIPGHPRYSITRDGRVWSRPRCRTAGGWLKPWSGHKGHLQVRLNGKGNYIHRLVWETFKGPIPKGFEIDHIDRDPTNNSLSNLRLVTVSQNQLNAGKQRRNTSGFKGVYQNKAKRMSWYGSVTVHGRMYRTRHFYTPEEAAHAVQELRERVCGEFAYHE